MKNKLIAFHKTKFELYKQHFICTVAIMLICTLLVYIKNPVGLLYCYLSCIVYHICWGILFAVSILVDMISKQQCYIQQ